MNAPAALASLPSLTLREVVGHIALCLVGETAEVAEPIVQQSDQGEDALEDALPKALDELHAALTAGTVRATGEVDMDPRRPIAPEEWRDLVLREEDGFFADDGFVGDPIPDFIVHSRAAYPAGKVADLGCPAEGGVPAASGGLEPAFHRHVSFVRVVRADVERLWPRTPERTKATAAGVRRCREWLIGKIQAGGPPIRKADLLAEAQERFGMSKRGFDDTWAEAVEATGLREWSRPGRRRKSQHP